MVCCTHAAVQELDKLCIPASCCRVVGKGKLYTGATNKLAMLEYGAPCVPYTGSLRLVWYAENCERGLALLANYTRYSRRMFR